MAVSLQLIHNIRRRTTKSALSADCVSNDRNNFSWFVILLRFYLPQFHTFRILYSIHISCLLYASQEAWHQIAYNESGNFMFMYYVTIQGWDHWFSNTSSFFVELGTAGENCHSDGVIFLNSSHYNLFICILKGLMQVVLAKHTIRLLSDGEWSPS